MPSFSEILTGVERLGSTNQRTRRGAPSTQVEVPRIVAALNSFSDCVRYLNTRRTGGALLALDSEAAVQDALYLMLRPWIVDLVAENPTDKVANRFSIKDFLSKANRVVIEAKYIRSADHGKSIVKELNDDIETYRYHPSCDDLIFFIYDPDGLIPDAAALERHISSQRSYEDKILRCHTVIKP
jgi:hypothetical protein